jgi:maltoporin
MKYQSSVIVFSCLIAAPVFAGETRFGGYFRTGTSYSKGLSKGVCYKEKVGAVANPGRFGNECDNLLELYFSHDLFGKKSDEKIWASLNVTTQTFFDGDAESEIANDDNPGYTWSGKKNILQLPQTFIEMGNAIGAGSTVWVGKRWYRRILFYQTDLFTLANNGNGFGVQDIDVGFGKAHLALIRNINSSSTKGVDGSPESSGPSYNNLDLRFTLPISGVSYDFIYIHQRTGTRDAYGRTQTNYKTATGDHLGVFSEYYGSFSNRFYIGYGRGLFGAADTWHLGAGNMRYSGSGFKTTEEVKDQDKSNSFVAINETGLHLLDKTLDMGISLLHTRVNNLKMEDKFVDGENFAVGLKPQYYFTENWSLVLDATQVQQSRDDYAKKHSLTKMTIGAVLKPQIAWAAGSPEIRAYVTQANWDKNANYPGDKPIYAEGSSGKTFGVQVDVAW